MPFRRSFFSFVHTAILSGLLLLSLAVNASAQVTFDPAKVYPTGISPTSIFSNDFNHDGIKDVVVAANNESNIYVHYGKSDGTYQIGQSFNVCGHPKKLVSGDFNKDGAPDIATLNEPQSSPTPGCPLTQPTVTVLYNVNGGFSSPLVIPLNATEAEDIAVGDLDGNGLDDLAVLLDHAKVHTIRFSSTANYQQADTTLPTTADGFERYLSLVLGDFNQDKRVDVATTYTNGDSSHLRNNAAIFLGKGDGTFAQTIFDGFGDVVELKAADINDDGRLDLVATVDSCRYAYACYEIVEVYLNGGSFGFDLISVASRDRNAFYEQIGGFHALAVGDFTGDGKDDIAFLASYNNEDILMVSKQGFDNTTDQPQFFQPRKIYLGGKLGASALAWTRIAGTSALPDLVAAAKNTNQFLAITDNTDKSGGDFCYVLNSPGVHICTPTIGSTQSSPVKISASARVTTYNPDAVIYRFEIWEGSTKLFAARDTEQLYASLALSNGSHTLTFVGRDVTGTHRVSYPLTFSVGASACFAPGSVGINVCSPPNGSTVSSPFKAKAYATVKGTVYRFSVWEGNTKLYEVRDSNLIDTTLSLPPGVHKLTWEARTSDGSSRAWTQSSVTVK